MTEVWSKSVGIILVVCLLVGTGLFIQSKTAFACSCAGPGSADEQVALAMEHGSLIYAGTVKSITPPKKKLVMSSGDLNTIVFEVEEVWKGDSAKEITVYTAMNSASCGYDTFQVGERYLVTANGPLEQLKTNICNMTMPLSSAGDQLISLGEGYAPNLDEPPSPTTDFVSGLTDGSKLLSIIVMAAAAVTGTLLVYLVFRHSR